MAYAYAQPFIQDIPPHHMGHQIPSSTHGGFREHKFNPYDDNGGSILGITGEDFVVLAGDTRHSRGYNINSRTEKKVHRLGKDTTLTIATVGFGADSLDVVEKMKTAVEEYKFEHNKEMSVSAAAQFLMTLLYGNRFFPKYTKCILVGIQDGKGRLYSYDPVGSYSKEGERRAAGGAADSLIVPFLDSQVEFKNQYIPSSNGTVERPIEHLPKDKVVKLVKDAFTSATERHIEVGDGLQILIIDAKDGVTELMYDLKKD